MPRIRIVIADDHALVRSAFRFMLGAQPDLEVVGEATDGVEVVAVCRRVSPDIVLMDLTMPGRGGIAATGDIRSTCPGTRVIAVTMHGDAAFARQAYLAGVSGYVLKTALANELITAIRSVFAGGRYFSSAVAEALQDGLPTPQSGAVGAGPGRLTQREQEVVRLVALGHTTQGIARELHISDKTVESHRRNITDKLGLRTRADIVRFALEYRLMEA